MIPGKDHISKKPQKQKQKKQLVPQGIQKARKHCEVLLQDSDLDPIKVCKAIYECGWDGDIWNRLDGSDEEVSKVSDSVPKSPLIKQEITTDDPLGNKPQTQDTTNIRDFNTNDLQKIKITCEEQPSESMVEWLYQLLCDRAGRVSICKRGRSFRPGP